jgi:hypothetical protein
MKLRTERDPDSFNRLGRGKGEQPIAVFRCTQLVLYVR